AADFSGGDGGLLSAEGIGVGHGPEGQAGPVLDVSYGDLVGAVGAVGERLGDDLQALDQLLLAEQVGGGRQRAALFDHGDHLPELAGQLHASVAVVVGC